MIDLKSMLKAGIHFGHRTSRWSPKMRPYIWGSKNRIHLIDVSKTAILLERAGKFLKDSAAKGGKFLFVGTKKAAQGTVHRVAISLTMPYVINRWVGGTLSNYDQVKKAVTRLLYMRDIMEKGPGHYKKKEISMMQKELARLEKNVGGIIGFECPPAAIVIVDAKKERSAVREASRLNVPVIALVDTNTDPSGISFVIPTNDDSPKSINFILEYLEQQVQEGVKEFSASKKEEEPTAKVKEPKKAKDTPVAAKKEEVKIKERPSASQAKSKVDDEIKEKAKKPVKQAAKTTEETKQEDKKVKSSAKSTTSSQVKKTEKVEKKKEVKTEKKAEAKETKE